MLRKRLLPSHTGLFWCFIGLASLMVTGDCAAQWRLRGRSAASSEIESPYPGYEDWELQPVRLASPPAAPHLAQPLEFLPNVLVFLEPGRVLSQMDRLDSQSTPVHDRILETEIQGASRNVTRTYPVLLPSDRGIEIELQMRTLANSQTVSRNRAATAQSFGTTRIVGVKKILLTPLSFQTTKARALAKTDSDMVGFQWGRRIGGNIARRRADEQSTTIEYINASKASRRAEDLFDQTVDHQVRMLQRQFRSRVQQLKSRGNYPDQLRLRSTSRILVAEAYFPNQSSGETSSPPWPAPTTLAADQLVIQIQESVVNQWLQQQLDQQDLSLLEESDWSERMGGILPISSKALTVQDEDRQWTLRMEDQRPFQLRLQNGVAQIQMNVANFRVGDREYPGMRIEADYDVSASHNRLTATRLGKLKLTPTEAESKMDASGNRRVGIRQQIFRSMVRKRFNPIFSEQIDASGMLDRLPRNLGNLQLRLDSLDYVDDWLQANSRVVLSE